MQVNNSNMRDVEHKLNNAIEKALRVVGGEAERLAKETISDMEAVDTGFLRNSITFAIAGEPPNISEYQDDEKEKTGKYEGTAPEDKGGSPRSVYIGSNVYYAPYVEYGTRKMGARPFLSQSIMVNQKLLEQLFRDAIKAFM